MFGPLLSFKRYALHNSSYDNVIRGLVERVYRVKDKKGNLVEPPTPKSSHFATTLLPELKKLIAYQPLRPRSLAHTVELWTGSKRKVYQRALESLRFEPLSRRDGYLSTFVKCEKIDTIKDDPAPRIIQPRSPRYNLHLARFIKPHEHEFYQRIDHMFDTDGMGDRTVFKGLNARSAAEHLVLKASRYSKPVFIGLDASRFDQHVSVDALQWEHSIYKNSFAYDIGQLSRLLDWQIDNIGTARLHDGRRIHYRVQGRRMSGDMNTSLGNCLIMCSMVHAYIRSKGIKASLANNGDDCVIVTEKKHFRRFDDLPEWFMKMGFNMKVEPPVYDVREVSFCQVNVVSDGNYHLCVRNPNVVTSKDLHSTYPFTHEHQYKQWLVASGICGSTSHHGVPVLEAFYSAFPQGSITDARIQSDLDNWRKYSIVGGAVQREISDEMRHSFWLAFKITPDCQIELERMYRNIRFGTSGGYVGATPYVSLYQL